MPVGDIHGEALRDHAIQFGGELRARIARKDKGKDVVEEAEAPAGGAEILDLMEALEQSVAAAKGRRNDSSGGGGKQASKAKAKTAKRTKSTARKSA